jgi:hypothetical protein
MSDQVMGQYHILFHYQKIICTAAVLISPQAIRLSEAGWHIRGYSSPDLLYIEETRSSAFVVGASKLQATNAIANNCD